MSNDFNSIIASTLLNINQASSFEIDSLNNALARSHSNFTPIVLTETDAMRIAQVLELQKEILKMLAEQYFATYDKIDDLLSKIDNLNPSPKG